MVKISLKELDPFVWIKGGNVYLYVYESDVKIYRERDDQKTYRPF